MNYKFKRKNSAWVWVILIVAFIVAISTSAGFTYFFVKNYVDENASGDTNIYNNNSQVTENHTDNYDVSLNFGTSSSAPAPSDLSTVVEKVMPATLTINVTDGINNGAGSGYIVEKAKVTNAFNQLIRYEYVAITNHHVIEGIKENNISVDFFIDGIEEINHSVQVIGSDYVMDVGVLRIIVPTTSLSDDEILALDINPVTWVTNETTKPTIDSIDDLDKINVSDDCLKLAQSVFVVGNPLGVLGGSVSTGIVSAKGRELTVEGIDCILNQLTATINRGNSGGGVFNYNGELVGMVKAKASGEGVEGLGFAIPVDDVFQTYVALRKTEERNSNQFGYIEGRKTIGVTFSQGYLTENQIALDSDYIEQVTQTLITFVSAIDSKNVNYVEGSKHFNYLTNQESVVSKLEVYRYNEELTEEDKYELVETITTKDLTPEKIQSLYDDSTGYAIGTKLVFTTRTCSTVTEPFEVSILISQLVYNPN